MGMSYFPIQPVGILNFGFYARPTPDEESFFSSLEGLFLMERWTSEKPEFINTQYSTRKQWSILLAMVNIESLTTIMQ